jgi:ubiquinone biosynthesis protein COQ9
MVVVVVLTSMLNASAQSPRSSTEIQAKVQKSAELQQQALRSLPDMGQAEALIDKAYAELQSAMSTMVIAASGMKTADPLLGLNEQKMRRALSHLQQATDTIKVNRRAGTAQSGTTEGGEASPGGAPPYLGVVRNNVEQALRLTNGVMLF